MLLQLDKVDDIEKNSLLDDKVYPLYRHHWNVHLETLQCITLIGLGPYNYLTPPLFIDVPVPSQVNERSNI